MKLYKYRKLTDAKDELSCDELSRIKQILRTGAFWCAKPGSLNDEEEFVWMCSYTPSPFTEELLATLLSRIRGWSQREAGVIVSTSIRRNDLRRLVDPVVGAMIHQCRDSFGIACFGASPTNSTLWDRYGGKGVGVCIEVDVPDSLMGTQLHQVRYRHEKFIHVDTLLRSQFDRDAAKELRDLALLSKSLKWDEEAEIRFLSKRQEVNVVIEGSRITSVILGSSVPPHMWDEIKCLAGSIPIVSCKV